SGKTTLSASGIILPSSCDVGLLATPTSNEPVWLVVTVASLIEPFLSPKYRDQISQVKPELIFGAQIDILLEGNAKVSASETLQWLPAELITLVDTFACYAIFQINYSLRCTFSIDERSTPLPLSTARRVVGVKIVDIPASSVSIQSLIGASAGSLEHSWEVGWSLASYNDGHQPYFDATQKEGPRSTIKRLGEVLGEQSIDSSQMGKLATRIAVMKLSSRIVRDLPSLKISRPNKRGDLLLAMGAPFGLLSPAHFCNSISVGYVSNCYPSSSSHASLLMADIRCLPVMVDSDISYLMSQAVKKQ
ncbi:glyoxysomal processing protease, glyoxysomal isoform X2, partial [Tanacetum coccineum]